MKIRFVILAALGALLLPVSAGAQMMGMQGGMGAGGMMHRSGLRAQYVRQNGVEAAYASRRNPLQHSPGNIAEGKKLYGQYCAVCHGPEGRGNGDAGKGLNPPPANIAGIARKPIASDGYLYWTIAEGGAPLGTAMPPFKSSLKKEEIWKLIVYLSTL
jgi:mono/diheme cytochrome c family protein